MSICGDIEFSDANMPRGTDLIKKNRARAEASISWGAGGET